MSVFIKGVGRLRPVVSQNQQKTFVDCFLQV